MRVPNPRKVVHTMKKRILAVALVIAFALVPTVTAYADEITVTVDGTAVQFADQAPVSIDGRTLVPVRGVFEMLGFNVEWEQATSTAVISSASYEIRITVDSNSFTTNGAMHQLDVPAQNIGGRMMIPIRLPLESVGINTDWKR